MASSDCDTELLKFPRTQHLFDAGGSGVSRDDLVMDSGTAELFYTPERGRGAAAGEIIVEVEEKVDGANLGISIDDGGQLRAQNRSHYVDSSTHKQFSALDGWLEEHRGELYDLLSPGNDILYGEWLAAKHSIHYTNLPDLFLAFDLFDRRAQRFCSRRERDRRLSESTSLSTVRLVYSGLLRNKQHVLDLLEEQSRFYDGPIEGVYIRIDEDAPGTTAMRLPLADSHGRKKGKGKASRSAGAGASEAGPWLRLRGKVVRPDFLQNIEEQWTRQKFTKNIVTYA
eukprot:scpid67490/ scgid11409/ 